MSPGLAAPTTVADQPRPRSPLGRFLFDHTINEYPRGGRRAGYLGLTVLATVVLYYVYYTQTGVTPNILAGLHMSFSFYIGIIVVSNLLGAFASLPASQTDRLGRTNVVIYGLLIVGLLTAIGIPLCTNEWSYVIVTCLIGIVEGAILVATPALLRDFSPQLGRATAMGFWTMGPVAGSLITSLVALHTLNHFGQTHWKSQFVISGVAALVRLLVSLFFLKDLSPKLRDQLMVSARDQALVEARAGLDRPQLLEAAEQPVAPDPALGPHRLLLRHRPLPSGVLRRRQPLHHLLPGHLQEPQRHQLHRDPGQRPQHLVLGGGHRGPDRGRPALRRPPGA